MLSRISVDGDSSFGNLENLLHLDPDENHGLLRQTLPQIRHRNNEHHVHPVGHIHSVLVGYAVATCAYSAFLDLVLSLLPWKLTDKLQMVRKEKIGVAMSTSFGIFACAAAVVKCYYIPLLQDRDFSYDGTNLVIWSVVEPSVTIVGASIPMLRVLFRDLRSQGGSRMNYGIKVTCGIKGNCKTVKTVSENTSRGRPSSAVESVHRKFPTCEDVDSRSDKSILERATSPLPDGKNGGILQVSEIKVEYSTRLQSDSHENFEMEDV
ncbi:hypothetical protein MKZ38_007630 [Zalerion maritima]|uniref:Rhodopsin domain-containing protein n=1 Tax=Zalerion maritima TaxID=339359 RepID=A0AAD5RYY6_9PEZI|nr:hypothetical protein MKZ38_007630 [Zalerion maritima]